METAQLTVRAEHVVNAGGAWGDVIAERAAVQPIGLQPLRRTAAIVPAPDWTAPWPLVMDIAGRFYVEPESGRLLLSPADETPSDRRRRPRARRRVALDRLAEATEIPVRSVRSS